MDAKDKQPGKPPAVHTECGITTIRFVIDTGGGRSVELVLRFDRIGTMYAAIALQ